MKVAVIGSGYVGLVTAAVLADLGNDVICVDKDPAKLDKIRAGVSPIYEPGLDELLRRCLAAGSLSVSDSVLEATKASEIVFIAVGTPEGPDGKPDLSAVRAVASEIARGIDKPTVVVNKSTVPVGSADLVRQIIIGSGADAKLFEVVSNPEFLREGTAIHDTMNPDRIVIGAQRPEAAKKLIALYEPFSCPVMVTDPESAELIKYASNSFLAAKISFINAISRLCELCGANVDEVAKGMGLDKRIGSQFLQSGLGWGGSCFPKDVSGLITTARELGYDFELLKSVTKVNADQTLNFVRRIEERLGTLKGKRIALLGLAFKPNTDDIRDAKSLVIVEEALKRGASIAAFDPAAAENVRALYPQIEYADDPYRLALGADALVVVTEWGEFRRLDLAKLAGPMRTRLLFDGRRIYSPESAAKAGFEYFAIGLRPSKST